MSLEIKETNRGFGLIEFTDFYKNECHIQDSSLAEHSCIWMGIRNPKIRILCSDANRIGIDTKGQSTGWMDYPIPENVLISSAMHLSQDQVKKILPVLKYFAETGNYIKDFQGEE